jgi:hypothetical protein
MALQKSKLSKKIKDFFHKYEEEISILIGICFIGAYLYLGYYIVAFILAFLITFRIYFYLADKKTTVLQKLETSRGRRVIFNMAVRRVKVKYLPIFSRVYKPFMLLNIVAFIVLSFKLQAVPGWYFVASYLSLITLEACTQVWIPKKYPDDVKGEIEKIILEKSAVADSLVSGNNKGLATNRRNISTSAVVRFPKGEIMAVQTAKLLAQKAASKATGKVLVGKKVGKHLLLDTKGLKAAAKVVFQEGDASSAQNFFLPIAAAGIIGGGTMIQWYETNLPEYGHYIPGTTKSFTRWLFSGISLGDAKASEILTTMKTPASVDGHANGYDALGGVNNLKYALKKSGRSCEGVMGQEIINLLKELGLYNVGLQFPAQETHTQQSIDMLLEKSVMINGSKVEFVITGDRHQTILFDVGDGHTLKASAIDLIKESARTELFKELSSKIIVK